MIIEPITELPIEFDSLRAEAHAEGFNHIDTLWLQWHEENRRFDRPGEMLVVARFGGDLAGIGGVTEDFVDPSWLRMRRFYVRPQYRRLGTGRAIAEYVLERALPLNRPIVLYTETPEGAAFWQAMGFVPIERAKTTHALGAHVPATGAN
jgi:GNAT superfamily N-acetyltransferase